jgi:anti-sigma factor RsiW
MNRGGKNEVDGNRMQPHDSHIADRDLLLEADGETSAARAASIRDHLSRCWSCRTRKAELERAIADFVQAHYRTLDDRVPPVDGSRPLLRARLSEAAHASQPQAWHERLQFLRPQPSLAWAGAAVLLVALGGLLAWLPSRSALRTEGEFAPNQAWTPGAVRPLDRAAVCAVPERDDRPVISPAVAQWVFSQYGIRDPRPRSYEVDYLIPPALGGSDDPRNLWPQPYSTGVWNARVKDALEDRLRSLVCGGELDLATAQRDLARDWIAAYKKYFRTGKPLLDHLAFVKDRPWE